MLDRFELVLVVSGCPRSGYGENLYFISRFRCIGGGEAEIPKRIPHYSAAPIYRCYLELARDLGIVDAGDLMERFPRFEFAGETGAVGVPFGDSDEEKAFYKEADILFDSMWGDSRILPLDDFLEEFKICMAKQWCEREGIEWYDRRPQSRRHTLPEAVEKTLKFLTVPEGLQ